MKLATLIATLLALAVAAVAQTDIQPPAASSTGQYLVGAGAGFSRAPQPQVTGWLVVGTCFKTGTCPFTEFQNVTGVTTTMQGGVLQQLAKSGNLSLAALGQVGGATTDGSLTAVFSGGLVVSYSRPNWSGLSIAVPIKAVKVNGTDVTLAIGFGVTKRF